ncbi:IS30 family transposase [Amycolatopsis sp. NPDC058340]|uniref:IS30 family transposase n=1 Tax=Amycolatopsis sp. NPDC058340 TaxID=3346453 RepID=UPI003663BC2E
MSPQTIRCRVYRLSSAERVARSLADKRNTLPDAFKNSVTWGQGKEMSHHPTFTMTTGMPVYFCDPRSPWQRGSTEDANGLLRQYLPKGTDLSTSSQDDLNELNGRPQQKLG